MITQAASVDVFDLDSELCGFKCFIKGNIKKNHLQVVQELLKFVIYTNIDLNNSTTTKMRLIILFVILIALNCIIATSAKDDRYYDIDT